jgi:hypothetical protein
MAYWPQKKLAELINNGEAATSIGYDGRSFFSTRTPSTRGRRAWHVRERLHGRRRRRLDRSERRELPGRVSDRRLGRDRRRAHEPREGSGVHPRDQDAERRRSAIPSPVGIIAPPRMQQRVAQLTNAKFIAQRGLRAPATSKR